MKFYRHFILVLSHLILIGPGFSQNWTQISKVTSNERGLNDQFGFSVAVSGDFAIAGCHRDDEDENGANTLTDAGAAYIFRREGCSWVMHQKIVASDRKQERYFGTQVAISGDYAFVGTYYEDEDENGNNPLPNAGALYVFKNTNGTWTQVQKIVPPVRAEQDLFSYDFETSGDLLVIGTYAEDEDENESNYILSAGSAYVYKNIGGVWTFQQKLVASDRGPINYFGFTVDVQENTIMVGAYNDPKDENGANPVFSAGSVYFFTFNGTQWVQTQKLVSYERASSNWFGNRVKLSGDYAFVGTPREAEDANGMNTMPFAGAVYVLRKTGGIWTHHQKLAAPDRAVQDFFGNNLAADGDHLLISAYREDEDSTGQNTLMDAGSAYLYKNISGSWQLVQKMHASDRGAGDFYSLRLDIDGDYMMISSSLDDEDSNGLNTIENSGSAYFYHNNDGASCDQLDVCDAISELSNEISSSGIPSGLINSLNTKLASALSSFQNGQNQAAINKLNAFINEVRAQSGKKIPSPLAAQWIESAQEIIDAINKGEANCSGGSQELRAYYTQQPELTNENSNLLKIFPNPVKNQIGLYFGSEQIGTLVISDIHGQVLFKSEVSLNKENPYLLNTGYLNLENGFYSLAFIYGDQIENSKIYVLK